MKYIKYNEDWRVPTSEFEDKEMEKEDIEKMIKNILSVKHLFVMLLETEKYVYDELKNKFPDDFDEILEYLEKVKFNFCGELSELYEISSYRNSQVESETVLKEMEELERFC